MGQKPPLKPKEIWSIRIRLQMSRRRRDLALFNLALDSKSRACDLVTNSKSATYLSTPCIPPANVRFQTEVESINSGA